jgi:exo-1,4-beta-D-glucosaminidase
VEVTNGKGGNEILPISYSDNYVTVFPGETISISGTYDPAIIGISQPWLKIAGYNTLEEIAPIHE